MTGSVGGNSLKDRTKSRIRLSRTIHPGNPIRQEAGGIEDIWAGGRLVKKPTKRTRKPFYEIRHLILRLRNYSSPSDRPDIDPEAILPR